MGAPSPDHDDDLPELAGDRAVTDAEREAFAADGHICLRALAGPAEVAAYRRRLLAAAEARRWETRPLAQRDTYGRAFLQMFNLWQHDDAAARFVLAARFGRVAAELMGVGGVRVYHDQALVKEAGGGHTPWHQDQGYWPVDTTDTVTMWMALDDIGPEVGSMTFASGSHRLGDVAAGAISDDSQLAVADVVARHGLETVSHGPMRAGDTTWHAGWTLHAAGPNPTDHDRPAMTVIYVADGVRISEPTEQQRFDLRWLGGRQPGELVDSAMNPLVWPVEPT